MITLLGFFTVLPSLTWLRNKRIELSLLKNGSAVRIFYRFSLPNMVKKKNNRIGLSLLKRDNIIRIVYRFGSLASLT